MSDPASIRPDLPSAPGSFRRQIVTLTVCVTAFGMVVLSIALQVILSAQTSRDIDRVLEDRAEAVADAVTAPRGSLVAAPSTLDEGVVVYDSRGAVVAGTVPAALSEQYVDLSGITEPAYRSVDDEARLRGVPFTTTSGVSGVVVVTERLTPYEKAEGYALYVSLATGLLATLAAGLIAAWGTRRALRPVAALTTAAAQWSEHDLTRRFDLGEETNELTTLAGVLDRLLDRVASAISSEQRLTSELAHELRTPLTAIRTGVDLVLQRPDLDAELRGELEETAEAARRMSETISTLLELARGSEAILRGRGGEVLEVIESVLESHPTAGVEVEVSAGGQRLGVSAEVAARALSPVVANALRLARSLVQIDAGAAAGMVEIRIEDDGSGVSPDGDIFASGITDGSGSGPGLGLALARRVADGVGGAVICESPSEPTVFVVRLPRG